MATRQRFGISYRDAAILEAARTLGCEIVLSEDLGDGQDYAGVRVENPFRDCGVTMEGAHAVAELPAILHEQRKKIQFSFQIG
jgi:hypothetical protein